MMINIVDVSCQSLFPFNYRNRELVVCGERVTSSSNALCGSLASEMQLWTLAALSAIFSNPNTFLAAVWLKLELLDM